VEKIKVFYDREHRRAQAMPNDGEIATALAAMQRPGHRYKCIFECLERPGDLRAVELGFGQLTIAGALAQTFAAYTATDISSDVITRGQSVPVDFKRADLCDDFPFDDETFDVVIAMMIVEHLFDPFHSFREMARICRPGGHVFVNLPNIGSIRCRLDLLCGRLPYTSQPDWFDRRQWDCGHLHYFTVDSVRRLAALSGLELIRLDPVGRFLAVKAMRPSLFCHEISYSFRKL
jgi:SAM-dependent methyltransferase